MADELNNGLQVQSTQGHEDEAINVAGLKAALQKFKTDKVDPMQWPMVAVAELPTATASTMHKIYLVPSTNPKQKNAKDEFITIATTETVEEQEVTTYSWEQIGSTTADLSNYVNKVNVGNTEYTPSGGAVSLPAYPTTLPASDVYSWAKEENKPSYTLSEVGAAASVVALTENVNSTCSITGAGNAGKMETIVYTNSSGSSKTVTIPTTYSTPDGAAITLTVPDGGYCEVNYLNISGTIYARGV